MGLNSAGLDGGPPHRSVFILARAPLIAEDRVYKWRETDLISRSSDLVNRLMLWYMCGGDDVSSHCVSLGLFDRALSQPALLYMGILVVAGVHFDVSG